MDSNIFPSWRYVGKESNKIKLLVSAGNLGWLISGILTANIPLIASNGICLVVMIAEIAKTKRGKKAKHD